MKFPLLICFQFIMLASFAQKKDIKAVSYSTRVELDSVNTIFKSLKAELKSLKIESKKQALSQMQIVRKFDSLKIEDATIANSISSNYLKLHGSIDENSSSSKKDFGIITETIKNNTLYGIIAILSLLIISFVAYWLINRYRIADKTEISNKLENTRLTLEESLVLEFGKQTILLDKELTVISTQSEKVQRVPEIKLDHSLALKVASEINLIERNVRLMDPKAKGLKQVVASVEKLRDNLAANGYDIPELLGKPFNKGMNVIVAMSIIDDALQAGEEIISRILIPQVNYENKMILTAQIEVSVSNS